ncbi:MAG: amino acid/polyamine transporter I [Benjaminiella poitrasii]|nr:MAG: amino acid/polyamine transporter I [Benjaminiella poitrasii]
MVFNTYIYRCIICIGIHSGGEQEYLAYQFPQPKQLISFIFLIMVGVIARGASLAQGATVFGNNILYAMDGPHYRNEWTARGFAVLCLTLWLLLSSVSTKVTIGATNLFTSIKIALLMLLICVGFAGLAGRLPQQPDLSQNFSFEDTSNNLGSYASAIYYVIFAYEGWYNLNYVIDELKDPIRNLPRCAISALILTTTLYLLANVAYLAVLPITIIKSSNLTVAANLFNAAFGGGIFGGHILPVLVGCSSFGFVGVTFYSGSRVVLEAARKGFLPYHRFFSQVHPTRQTPMASLCLLYSIALIFLLAPPPGTVFQFIIAFSGYSSYFFSALSVIGLLLLRWNQPDIKRPVRVPWIISIVFVLICLFMLIFVFVPPTTLPNEYPYWLPYIVSISLAILSTGLWYYKIIFKNSTENSYNAEIFLEGQQELFHDVYQNTKDIETDSAIKE